MESSHKHSTGVRLAKIRTLQTPDTRQTRRVYSTVQQASLAARWQDREYRRRLDTWLRRALDPMEPAPQPPRGDTTSSTWPFAWYRTGDVVVLYQDHGSCSTTTTTATGVSIVSVSW